jgi:hypothetical protein
MLQSHECAATSPDFSYLRGGFPSVSPVVRDIIEELEPGVHQFFPVKLLNADGSEREKPRFVLNICTVADAIITGHYTRLKNGESLFHPGRNHPVKVKKKRIASLHVWLDRRAPREDIFVSNELFRRFSERGIGAFAVGTAEEK